MTTFLFARNESVHIGLLRYPDSQIVASDRSVFRAFPLANEQ